MAANFKKEMEKGMKIWEILTRRKSMKNWQIKILRRNKYENLANFGKETEKV